MKRKIGLILMLILIIFSFALVINASNTPSDTNEVIIIEEEKEEEKPTNNYHTSHIPSGFLFEPQIKDDDLTIDKTVPKEELKPTYELAENGVIWYSSFRPDVYNEKTVLCGGYEIDIDFFAKLLYREAGSMGWEGQVYVASAILNLCDKKEMSVWEAGHITRIFSVAPYVDNTTPLPKQYEVIDYVLNGGRVSDVKYFRTNYYHGFGTPVCQIENVCFSK